MIVTISWPRFAQLLRELEDIPDATADEIGVRLTSFARRAFDEAFNQFGSAWETLQDQHRAPSLISTRTSAVAETAKSRSEWTGRVCCRA